jgi:hypothetical protein
MTGAGRRDGAKPPLRLRWAVVVTSSSWFTRQRTGDSGDGGILGGATGGGGGAADTSSPIEATKAVIERNDITHLPCKGATPLQLVSA